MNLQKDGFGFLRNSHVLFRALGMVSLAIAIGIGWVLSSQVSEKRGFALDDSFITFVYARQLAEGNGLRYNKTDLEPTEGASSLLHVWVAALGIRLGMDPLTLTRGLNLVVLFAAAGAIAAALSHGIGHRPDASVLAVTVVLALVAFLPETLPHMASGMETIMSLSANIALFAWAMSATLRPEPGSWVQSLLGGILTLAVLVLRPEGAIFATTTLGAVFLARWQFSSRQPFLAELRFIAPATVVFVLGLAVLLLWKVNYFGDVVPNAYWVKSDNRIFGTTGQLFPGLKQVAGFAAFRWLPLFILSMILFSTNRTGRSQTLAILVLLLPSLFVLAAYLFVIHEAASAFRYGYPLIAPLLVVLSLALVGFLEQNAIRAAMVVAVTLFIGPALATSSGASLFHWIKEPVFRATRWVNYVPDVGGMDKAALDLRDTGLGNDATVLLTAAGLVPWHSRFHSIDWIGLNNNVLSGKYPLSINEVWNYIESQEPDVVVSFVPPASPGATSYSDDPAFQSTPIRNTLKGIGTKLFQNWDQRLISEMLWREMAWIRDNTFFGACYGLKRDWIIVIYISKNSPHREKIAETLSTSLRPGCNRLDLAKHYHNDPRQLGSQD